MTVRPIRPEIAGVYDIRGSIMLLAQANSNDLSSSAAAIWI